MQLQQTDLQGKRGCVPHQETAKDTLSGTCAYTRPSSSKTGEVQEVIWAYTTALISSAAYTHCVYACVCVYGYTHILQGRRCHQATGSLLSGSTEGPWTGSSLRHMFHRACL